MPVQLIWGCNPIQQFEQAWVKLLLQPSLLRRDGTVLVESGLLRLERSPSVERLHQQNQARLKRIAALADEPFTLIHLSDEEGLDADTWYNQLPSGLTICRNFYHQRFYNHFFDIFSSFSFFTRSVNILFEKCKHNIFFLYFLIYFWGFQAISC